MKQLYITFILMAVSGSAVCQFPQALISNGIIDARIYLPHPTEGYYRGSRFDWAGVMPELNFGGHTFFGQWFEKYSPTLHDAIMGPVEDFYPVGYDVAKAGGSFLKIGIGMVMKPSEPRYSFANTYQLTNPGTWKIKKRADHVEFIHTLTDTQYAYHYTKKVQLLKDKPVLVLSHALKNTGRLPIETTVYDHNFFVMDDQPVGPGYVISFPFNLSSEIPGNANLGTLAGNRIIFSKELSKSEHLFYQSLKGFSDSAKDYDIRIENHKTGAAVRITSDRPLSRIVFWSAAKTLCPEPYLDVKVKPGEIITWNIYYEFYVCDIVN